MIWAAGRGHFGFGTQAGVCRQPGSAGLESCLDGPVLVRPGCRGPVSNASRLASISLNQNGYGWSCVCIGGIKDIAKAKFPTITLQSTYSQRTVNIQSTYSQHTVNITQIRNFSLAFPRNLCARAFINQLFIIINILRANHTS